MKTKILLLFAIFFSFAITTKAQITEGKYLLGGSFNLNSATNQNSNSVYTNIQFGKVIKENTIAGIMGSIVVTNNNSSGQRTKVNQYSAGVFYRKYKPLKNNFYFFGEIDASYQTSENTYTYFSTVDQTLYTKSNTAVLNFIPGIAYSITKHLQMELSMPNLAKISYTSIKTIDKSLPSGVDPQKANNISANINLNSSLLNNFAIGFKFLLGK